MLPERDAGTTRIAACACGQLSAICRGEPDRVSLCHCQQCQKRTGSAFGVAAFFRLDRVIAEGASRAYSRTADSGLSVRFHFCETCGSTVYWYPERTPGRIGVAVGAFADPDFPRPSQSVFEAHRPRWMGEWPLS
jgi:hypothetical protein